MDFSLVGNWERVSSASIFSERIVTGVGNGGEKYRKDLRLARDSGSNGILN